MNRKEHIEKVIEEFEKSYEYELLHKHGSVFAEAASNFFRTKLTTLLQNTKKETLSEIIEELKKRADTNK